MDGMSSTVEVRVGNKKPLGGQGNGVVAIFEWSQGDTRVQGQGSEEQEREQRGSNHCDGVAEEGEERW
jgi:hypothetical protein